MRFHAPKSLLLLLSLLIVAGSGCAKASKEEQFQELVARASKYQQAGQFDEARITLLRAIDLKPHDAELYFELGELMFRKQRYGAALENYHTALNENPLQLKARLRIVSLLLVARRYEQAEVHVETLKAQAPADIEVLLLQAAYLASVKRPDEAEAILRQVLEREPENPIALANMADVALADGRRDEAQKLLKRSLAVKPNQAAVGLALADLYTRDGRFQDAQRVLQSMVEELPAQPGLRSLLAEYMLRRGLGERAVTEFETVLSVDPLQHHARDRLYDMYLLRGNNARAFELTQSLKELAPNEPSLRYFYGRDLELQGKAEEALPLYIRSLEGLSAFAPAFRRAGQIELKLGKRAEAIEHFNQALAINPADIDSRLAVARDFLTRGETHAAIEHVEKVLSMHPRQLEANLLRADAALLVGQSEKARVVYAAVVNDYPESPLGYYKLALLEERQGNAQEAIRLYTKTLSFNEDVRAPLARLSSLLVAESGVDGAYETLRALHAESEAKDSEYRFAMAAVLFSGEESKYLEPARALLEQIIQTSPEYADAYRLISALEMQRGAHSEAVNALKTLISLEPRNSAAHLSLALEYEKLGQQQDAIEVYQKLLAFSPRNGAAANNLAFLLANQVDGDLDTALELALVAKEELPSAPHVADTLGWVYFQRGLARAALPLIEEALEGDKKLSSASEGNPDILYHLGAVLHSLGRDKQAEAVLKNALKTASRTTPSHTKIKKLLLRLGSLPVV